MPRSLEQRRRAAGQKRGAKDTAAETKSAKQEGKPVFEAMREFYERKLAEGLPTDVQAQPRLALPLGCLVAKRPSSPMHAPTPSATPGTWREHPAPARGGETTPTPTHPTPTSKSLRCRRCVGGVVGGGACQLLPH